MNIQTRQVNGRLIRNETVHVIITATGRFDRSFGNNSTIDVIGTSVKANYNYQDNKNKTGKQFL
jgi:hypothetical protein